jgi:hypothetical protein
MNFDDIKRIYPELIEEWMRLDDNPPWQIIEGVSKTRTIDAINSFNHLDVDITKNLTLLDIGCECGLYSMPATQKFKKVIGIDNNEVSIKRALKTKDIFIKNGYDVSNFEAKHLSFEEYCINPKYQVDEPTFTHAIWEGYKYSDLTLNSIFHEDGINAILASEILHLFDDNLMNIFNKILENIELIMIQSKFKEKNQWEWDTSEYAQSPSTKIKKWNSYENYAMDEIVKYLKNNNFNNIEIHPTDSNCGVAIGVL